MGHVKTRKTIRWDNNYVPYEIDNSFVARSSEMTKLLDGIALWNSQTDCELKKRTDQGGYILFVLEDLGLATGSSRIGKGFGQDKLRLSNGAAPFSKYSVLHEMGHTVGLAHEHTRNDRDEHITVHKDNIHFWKRSNFRKKRFYSGVEAVGFYDLKSMMHYGNGVFAIDPTKDTITANNRALFGYVDISKGDIQSIKRLYGNLPGKLMWYKYLDGSSSWENSHGLKISSGFDNFRQVIIGGEKTFYAVNASGELVWYKFIKKFLRLSRWVDNHARVIGSGWDAFKFILSNANNIIYAIKPSGDLMWYKHIGQSNGSADWANPHGIKIGSGWHKFKAVFGSHSRGIIYAIKTNGDLMHYNHLGENDGSVNWENSHGVKIGSGWDKFKSVSAGNDGYIYAIKTNGDLMMYQFLGLNNGTANWENSHGVKIGSGWQIFCKILADVDGNIFPIV